MQAPGSTPKTAKNSCMALTGASYICNSIRVQHRFAQPMCTTHVHNKLCLGPASCQLLQHNSSCSCSLLYLPHSSTLWHAAPCNATHLENTILFSFPGGVCSSTGSGHLQQQAFPLCRCAVRGRLQGCPQGPYISCNLCSMCMVTLHGVP